MFIVLKYCGRDIARRHLSMKLFRCTIIVTQSASRLLEYMIKHAKSILVRLSYLVVSSSIMLAMLAECTFIANVRSESVSLTL